jgi:hypothetical protein
VANDKFETSIVEEDPVSWCDLLGQSGIGGRDYSTGFARRGRIVSFRNKAVVLLALDLERLGQVATRILGP